MANIRFGWKNHCLESGVTFGPSSEAAAHDADNLGKVHPSKFWRMSTVTGTGSVTVIFPRTVDWDVIAPLYVLGSPHQNLMTGGFRITTTDWTALNVEISSQSGIITGNIPKTPISATEAGSVDHTIAQTYTKPVGSDAWQLTVSLYVDISTSDNLRLQIDNGAAANRAFVVIDTSDGSVQSSGDAGGAYSFDSASSTLVSGTVYRVVLTATGPAEGSIRTVMYIMDASFNTVYVAAGEAVSIGGVTLELGGSVGTAIDSITGKASFWSVRNFDQADLMPLPARRSMQEWYAAVGFLHSFKLYGTTQYGTTETVYLFDTGNADAQLDTSNIYIGPTWSPTKNLSEDFSWGVDPITGGRVLSLTIPYADEDEFKADAMPMALTAGVGIKSAAVADGGQEFRRDRRPVLVLLDPDATTYAQEDMIYGWVDEFRIRANKYIADVDGSGTSGLAYAVEMTIKEVLP